MKYLMVSHIFGDDTYESDLEIVKFVSFNKPVAQLLYHIDIWRLEFIDPTILAREDWWKNQWLFKEWSDLQKTFYKTIFDELYLWQDGDKTTFELHFHQ